MSIKIGTILSMKVGKFVVVLYYTDSEREILLNFLEESRIYRRSDAHWHYCDLANCVYMLSTEGCKI